MFATKTTRYYEEVDLLVPKVRATNGYRQYEANKIHVSHHKKTLF
jgi:DNA-binding transcriptional MerR regulator